LFLLASVVVKYIPIVPHGIDLIGLYKFSMFCHNVFANCKAQKCKYTKGRFRKRLLPIAFDVKMYDVRKNQFL